MYGASFYRFMLLSVHVGVYGHVLLSLCIYWLFALLRRRVFEDLQLRGFRLAAGVGAAQMRGTGCGRLRVSLRGG